MNTRLSIAGLCVATALTSGCQEPLFPDSVPRSQYQRYDELRGRRRDVLHMNMFGREETDIYERLRPLD